MLLCAGAKSIFCCCHPFIIGNQSCQDDLFLASNAHLFEQTKIIVCRTIGIICSTLFATPSKFLSRVSFEFPTNRNSTGSHLCPCPGDPFDHKNHLLLLGNVKLDSSSAHSQACLAIPLPFYYCQHVFDPLLISTRPLRSASRP